MKKNESQNKITVYPNGQNPANVYDDGNIPQVDLPDNMIPDEVPRKDGPGISQSDILVINKIDLAPYVHASLEVMDHDSRLMRPGTPFIFTNTLTGENVDKLVDMIFKMALIDKVKQS